MDHTPLEGHSLRIYGQHKFDFRVFRKRKQKTGSWVGWEAGVDLGEVEEECDQDQNTLYERTHKNEEETIRTEQAMNTRETPLMAPTLQYQGQHRKLPFSTCEGIPSHNLFI